MHQKVFEGTWEEVSKQAAELGAGAHVRLEVYTTEGGSMIRFGMFPQLAAVSDDDFHRAEWHGDDQG